MTRIRLYFWPHRLLFLGPDFETGLHRHHAAQFCVGLDGALRLRERERADWISHCSFFVPSDQAHEFAAAGTATAILYVEAQSGELEAWGSRDPENRSLRPWNVAPRALDALRELAVCGGAIEQADAVCLRLLGLSELNAVRRCWTRESAGRAS